MFLDETSDQQALRKELREYFASIMTPSVRAELDATGKGGEIRKQIVRRLGADGWLGLGWPVEYGGQGRPPEDQFVFFDEAQRATVPIPFVTLNTVGPTLMRFGTEEQKQRFLAPILAGEMHFAIGYTEPEAGTDLAALRTKAVRDGDEYVVNGSKVFTSGANDADYIWLACRTDFEAKKHKGISLILVPTDSPGFSWTPIHTVGGQTTTATFYDDVRVPVANRIGDENAGWQLITTQLNHERVGLAAVGGLAPRLWDDVADWCRITPSGDADHPRVADLPWVQSELARTYAKLEAMRLLNWRMVKATADGTLGAGDSSAVKVYSTEAVIDVYDTLLHILGAGGQLRAGSSGAALAGQVEQASRRALPNTFGGGSNEVQRELVATGRLGMARVARQVQS
jgi:3-oxocholest-4-en-26-oyl-CoA dehydrogenase alpha subunit